MSTNNSFLQTLKQAVLITLYTIFLFLLVDFVLSKTGVANSLIYKIAEKNYMHKGIMHPVYHHDLAPLFDEYIAFGPLVYRHCTDENGFRAACSKILTTENNLSPKKHYDLAFLGDSFTEAVGVPYEQSFVGLFSEAHPELNVANLGVSSYSPIIYFKKLEYYLNQGFSFAHLIVFIDISDIQDEGVYYKMENGTVQDNKEEFQKYDELKGIKLAVNFDYKATQAENQVKRNIALKQAILKKEKSQNFLGGWLLSFKKMCKENFIISSTYIFNFINEFSKPLDLELNNTEKKLVTNATANPTTTSEDMSKDMTGNINANIITESANELVEESFLDISISALAPPSAPIQVQLSKNVDKATSSDRSEWTHNSASVYYGQAGVAAAMSKAVEYMLELKKLADAHNIKLSVAVYPWPGLLRHDQKDNRQVRLWRNFCRKYSCEFFIDANAYFYDDLAKIGLEETINKYYIPRDAHFNANGNAMLFKELDRQVKINNKQVPSN